MQGRRRSTGGKGHGEVLDIPGHEALHTIEQLKNSHSGIDQFLGRSMDAEHGDMARAEVAGANRAMEEKIKSDPRLQPDSPAYQHSGIDRFLTAGGGTK
jgi:hypothetical protein